MGGEGRKRRPIVLLSNACQILALQDRDRVLSCIVLSSIVASAHQFETIGNRSPFGNRTRSDRMIARDRRRGDDKDCATRTPHKFSLVFAFVVGLRDISWED